MKLYLSRAALGALAVGAALTLTSCSAIATVLPWVDPNAEVVSAVRGATDTTLSSEEIVEYVDGACDHILNGSPNTFSILGLLASAGVVVEEAGAVLNAGMSVKCPDAIERLDEVLQ